MDDEVRTIVSVIVPTYNRPGSLYRALTAISQQSFPLEKIEVVVIDDGSNISYESVLQQKWLFSLSYRKQTNLGEPSARNLGVDVSMSEFIISLDDDIVLAPNYIEEIYRAHEKNPDAILTGVLYPKIEERGTIFQHVMGNFMKSQNSEELSFIDLGSGTMALSKEIYRKIGGMRPLISSGRNAWGGMDFGFRAYQGGFPTRVVANAIAVHDDYAIKDLETYCFRMRKVSQLAVLHFQRSKELISLVPMYRDKLPIQLGKDPVLLVFRKMLRKFASAGLSIWVLEKSVQYIEKSNFSPKLLERLYRWITGGHIYRGYHEGLKQYGPVYDAN